VVVPRTGVRTTVFDLVSGVVTDPNGRSPAVGNQLYVSVASELLVDDDASNVTSGNPPDEPMKELKLTCTAVSFTDAMATPSQETESVVIDVDCAQPSAMVRVAMYVPTLNGVIFSVSVDSP
jgi:hypothetical protein